MAKPNSTVASRPRKPYPDFPLTPRGDGRWCKRIRGKLFYFRGTADEALKEYKRQRDDLYAGREATPKHSEVTLRDACNAFLTFKADRVDSGELRPSTFKGYKAACRRVIDCFGRERSVASLGPGDFIQLRRELTESMGAAMLSTDIVRIRSLFKFALD